MAEEEVVEEQAEEQPKKSSSMMLVIIIIVLILVILLGGIAAILMMGGDDETSMQQQTPQSMERSNNSNQQSSHSNSNAPITEVGPMFPLDAFTVNLLSESGRRYLKVEMNLELSGEELGAELENKTAVVRDIIIRLLSSKSLEEISTAKGKEKLKEQIVDQLNMRLRDGHINNVYFTEFVVQ